jgi:sporulation protein YunB
MFGRELLMFKKNLIYHRLWYVKRRQARRLYTYTIILVVIIIFTLLISYAEKTTLPYLKEICEYKGNSIITMVINEAVGKEFRGNIKYEDIVKINKDANEHIVSIQTDVVKLNTLSSRLATEIQEKLSAMGKFYIDVPSGVLIGNPILAGIGPEMHIAVIPAGNVDTDFKSEFSSAGINQTRHRIFLQIKTRIGIMVPLIEKNCEVVNNIPVAETVIVGEIPGTYLNIDGTKN